MLNTMRGEHRSTYPDLREILVEARKSANLSIPEMAAETKIKTSTLQSYWQGNRRPSARNIEKLAKILATKGDSKQAIARKLTNACVTRKPPKSLLEALADGEKDLSGRILRLPPFSDRVGVFFEDFYKRFFQHLGVNYRFSHTLSRTLREPEEQLQNGDIDFLLNFLCIPPRLLNSSFLLTPIRISLNACCFRSDTRHIPEIQSKILGLEQQEHERVRIKLIVVSWGVATWFANHVSKEDIREV